MRSVFGLSLALRAPPTRRLCCTVVKPLCIASFASAYPALTIQQLLLPQYSNPFDVPVLVSILNHLIMGTSGGTPAEPQPAS